MKYLYWDLGEQQHDNGVVVHLRGSAANVILLDPVNFDRYRYGLSFRYTGGLHTGTPVRLEIPKDGHWYLVVDCCGYQHHVQVKKVQMLPAEELPSASDQSASEVDRMASEADPRASEVDRTASEADPRASEVDATASDADPRASEAGSTLAGATA